MANYLYGQRWRRTQFVNSANGIRNVYRPKGYMGAINAVGAAVGAPQAYNAYQWATNSTSSGAKAAPGGAAPFKGKKKQKKQKRKRVKGNKALTKRVNEIDKSMEKLRRSDDQSTGIMTYRKIFSDSLKATVNSQASVVRVPNSVATLEVVLAECLFFDPSAPTVLIKGSLATGAYQRNTMFDSITAKTHARNNYTSDCKIKIYLMQNKDDTDLSPTAAWDAGVANGSYGAIVDRDTVNQYPSDYDVVNDLYKSTIKWSGVLSPGQSVDVSHTETNISYDSSTTDTHSLNYQKEYKCFHFMTVIEGTIAHDSSVDQQGLGQAGIDIVNNYIYKVRYNAGVNMTYTYLVEDLDEFTNGAVQSHQPVADNIAYSIA